MTAGQDGGELIAELEILIKREEEIPQDAIEVYNKDVGGWLWFT